MQNEITLSDLDNIKDELSLKIVQSNLSSLKTTIFISGAFFLLALEIIFIVAIST